MGLIIHIKKFLATDDFYKSYYEYIIMTNSLKSKITDLENLEIYARNGNIKNFLKVFLEIKNIRKIDVQRENTYNKLKDLFEEFMMNNNERSLTKKEEYFQWINEERDIENKNGFRDLIRTLTYDLPKITSNFKDAEGILNK